jgi:Zn-dependent peptidase ImmA (M78 family)
MNYHSLLMLLLKVRTGGERVAPFTISAILMPKEPVAFQPLLLRLRVYQGIAAPRTIPSEFARYRATKWYQVLIAGR